MKYGNGYGNIWRKYESQDEGNEKPIEPHDMYWVENRWDKALIL